MEFISAEEARFLAEGKLAMSKERAEERIANKILLAAEKEKTELTLFFFQEVPSETIKKLVDLGYTVESKFEDYVHRLQISW